MLKLTRTTSPPSLLRSPPTLLTAADVSWNAGGIVGLESVQQTTRAERSLTHTLGIRNKVDGDVHRERVLGRIQSGSGERGVVKGLLRAEGESQLARFGLVVAGVDGRAVALRELDRLVPEPADAVDEHALGRAGAQLG